MPVGAERDRLGDAAVSVETMNLLAGLGLSNDNIVAAVTRGRRLPVRTEDDGVNRTRVPLKPSQTLAGGAVP